MQGKGSMTSSTAKRQKEFVYVVAGAILFSVAMFGLAMFGLHQVYQGG